MSRKLIALETFARAYNALATQLSGKELRKELAKRFGVHGNTVNNLIKSSRDVGIIEEGESVPQTNSISPSDTKNTENTETTETTETTEAKWVKTNLETSNADMDSFFTYSKSTLYGPDGEVKLDWVKTKKNEKIFYDNMKQAIQDMMQNFDGKYEKLDKIPSMLDEDLLTFYPIPDAHFGLLVEGNEVTHGRDWNLQRAKVSVLAGMEYLIKHTPNSKTCIITDLGDLLESENDDNRTRRHKNVLHTSDMHSKILKTTYEVLTQIIEMALNKHETVYFYSVPGNHGDLVPLYLTTYLSAYFRNEPRVVVCTRNTNIHYHQFGKNLLGFTHGHEIRPDNVAEVMIHDNRETFSQTKYSYAHFGHFHHNKRMQEMSLVNIEVHKNNLPTNYYADSHGYRSMSIGEAKAITYHTNYGEVSRNIFNLHLLD